MGLHPTSIWLLFWRSWRNLSDYVNLIELKAVLPDEDWGTKYDPSLSWLITRASRMIDKFTQREPDTFLVDADTVRYFDGRADQPHEVWIGELAQAPTTVEAAEGGVMDDASGANGTYTTWATSDYLLWPDNAVLQNVPFLRLDVETLNGTKANIPPYRKAMKITGRFGYSLLVPDDVKQAVTIQCMRWFKRGQQAFKDVGAITELGQLQFVQKIDPDVGNIVEHLARHVATWN